MDDEIEILKSIFYDDIVQVNLVDKTPTLEISLYPANTEENFNKKFIRLNLVVSFTSNYPEEIPKFLLKNVRGISDEYCLKIQNEIKEIAEKNIGLPMLYEIFQNVKDLLTNHGDIPNSCVCAICLYNFDSSQSFMRLECYHYFHTPCLLKHIDYMKNEIEKEKNEADMNKLNWNPRYISCPICRESLKDEELNHLNEARIEISTNEINLNNNSLCSISSKTRELQNKMKILFDKQKLNGGIIDIKENKQDIIILTRPPNNTNNDQQVAPINQLNNIQQA